MGDNRDRSDDSRYWGFVPDDHLRGRAFFIWFNWDDISSSRVQARRQRHSIGRAAMQMRTRQRGLSMIGFCSSQWSSSSASWSAFASCRHTSNTTPCRRRWNRRSPTPRISTPSAEIRNAFQKRADAGYIESVQGRDVEISKTKNEVTASASWNAQAPAGRQRQPVPRVRGFGDEVATSPAA